MAGGNGNQSHRPVRHRHHAAGRHALGARQVRLQADPVHGLRQAVVASPVGVNRDIVEHGVNGFLAETPEEWTGALCRLAADPDLRRRLGAAGRAKVERHYSLAGAARA
ncbi:hypothetical protein D3868_31995 (plasmid) [Azospirillum brasilense]|uniref:Glycosyl transferase family 1 domain-containing protein n=1 Tax=Azospirillum brasilense TaxID=192 RepID=A0A4D8QXF6_AZOBR|nr:hypothetical protein D3868_31995 [Azospirillum brasilense]